MSLRFLFAGPIIVRFIGVVTNRLGGGRPISTPQASAGMLWARSRLGGEATVRSGVASKDWTTDPAGGTDL